MFSSIGPLEIAIVVIIAILVLGPRRLPDAGRGLGRSMREFKGGLSGLAESSRTEKLEKTDDVRKANQEAD